MVRTRAEGKKAGGKAPRKFEAAAPPKSASSTSSSKSGMNITQIQPVPSWQKGIAQFMQADEQIAKKKKMCEATATSSSGISAEDEIAPAAGEVADGALANKDIAQHTKEKVNNGSSVETGIQNGHNGDVDGGIVGSTSTANGNCLEVSTVAKAVELSDPDLQPTPTNESADEISVDVSQPGGNGRKPEEGAKDSI